MTVLLIARNHNENSYYINMKIFISYEITRSDLGLKTSNTDLLLVVQAYTYPHLR
jgi:hypothetical protein